MKDVAKLADVSIATVSRYINDSGYVGEKTRVKISQAIKKLKYQPNEIARSLNKTHSKIIGLLIPDITNPFFTQIAKGVELRVNNEGYVLVLCSASSDDKSKHLKTLRQYKTAGIITAVEGADKTNNTCPIVSIDRRDEDIEYAVYSNDYIGGRLIGEELVMTSAEKVKIISGPLYMIGARERLRGTLETLNEHGINYDVDEVMSFNAKRAFEHYKLNIEEVIQYDSIVVPNDVFALHVINELRVNQIDIPGKIQVIGYDNIEYSKLSMPAITTVEQYAIEMGYKGADLLFKLINNEPIDENHVIIKPSLIRRDSSRKY